MDVATTTRERVVNLVSESIYDNPVVTREFRTRMRGWKAFAVMGGYALFLAAIMFVAYVVIWNQHSSNGPNQGLEIVDRNVGMELFLWLAWTQAILLSLIIPSLTFSAITHEIERKTMEMLALTRLSPGKVVLGKQLAGFLYALVLLICSAPLAGMCLMFGGISPGEIALWYCVLVAWCWLLTCAGVFWSSLFTRTAAAALFTYGTAMVYFLMTIPFGAMTFMPVFGARGGAHIFGALNPAWAAYTVALGAQVCSVKVPLSVAAMALHFSLGTLLLLVASTHVKHHKAERAPAIRLLLVGITVLIVWLLVGNMSAMGGGLTSGRDMRNLISLVASILFPFIALLTCSVATGEVKKAKGQSVPVYALSPGKVLRSDLGGAIIFTFLWMLAAYAAFGATLRWVASSQHFVIPPGAWMAYYKVGVSILAMSVGVAAFGVLASCIVKSRRNAAALVLLFLILIFAGYGVVMAYYVPSVNTHTPVWQLAAFWPMTPIMASTGGWEGNMPDLWWKPEQSWLVTSAAYLVIAILALVLGSRPMEKIGGVVEE